MIISSLEERLKELRRAPKKKEKGSSESSTSKAPCVVKVKPHKPFEVPPVPDGEDDISFKRHNNVLKAEHSKANNITITANKLMDHTFAQRRREMLDSKDDVKKTFQKYPYLQESAQV